MSAIVAAGIEGGVEVLEAIYEHRTEVLLLIRILKGGTVTPQEAAQALLRLEVAAQEEILKREFADGSR